MRVPRQWSGADLKKALAALGYEETRQTGSHVRLTTQMHGVHHVTVPDHKVLPLGTSSRSSEMSHATSNARPTRSWRVCWGHSDAINRVFTNARRRFCYFREEGMLWPRGHW